MMQWRSPVPRHTLLQLAHLPTAQWVSLPTFDFYECIAMYTRLMNATCSQYIVTIMYVAISPIIELTTSPKVKATSSALSLLPTTCCALESPINVETAERTTLIITVVSTVVVVLAALLLVTVFILCMIRRHRKSKVKQRAAQHIDHELRDMIEEDNHPSNTYNSIPVMKQLEVSNPFHHSQNTSVYSEVSIENIERDVNGTLETKIITENGEEFTGLYNVITPIVTSTNNGSETIVPKGYSVISIKDVQTQNKESVDEDESAYAVPDLLVVAKKKESIDEYEDRYAVPDKPFNEAPLKHWSVNLDSNEGEKVQPEAETKEDDEEFVERERMYSEIGIRKAPVVPSKSTDLVVYLDTQSAFNAGIYNESINPLDFTRDRMKDGKDYPEILAPVCISAPVLSETDQDCTKVTSTNIIEKMKLGTGHFGEVVLADTNGLSLKTMKLSKTDDNQNISIVVAVKKMKPTHQEAFNNEVKFMCQLRHPNVLRLLGVCYQDPAFIMMEYTEEGDLNQFLQKYSEIVTTQSSEDQVTLSELVYIASKIASGMQYLAKLNFIHRDLATRSCFVGRNNSIKVGSLGVNTSLYKSNYYRIRGNRLLPIRWMASECFNGKFSEKSDVWAFGVTMWELFTLAKKVPYPHLSDDEVIHNALKREYRQFPSQPTGCPDDVYEIMEQCWNIDMKQRTTFKELHRMLH